MKKIRYNRVKAVLADKRVQNKELAEKMGVTEGTVSTWCRNFKQPKIETLFAIAKYLKIEASELLSSMKGSGL
jgi:transcriptional regulator with XRE-family HTH domain